MTRLQGAAIEARTGLLIGLVVFLTCMTLSSDAAPVPTKPSEVVKRRVLVLPGHDYRLDPANLFMDGDPPTSGDEGGALSDVAAATLRKEVEISVALRDGLSERGDGGDRFDGPDLAVRGLLHLGQERYRDIRIPEAISALEQGIASARKAWLDILAPDVLSDLYLYQGLSYLELNQVALSHAAFKNMLTASPRRKFRKGWFPPATEAALKAAAEDFIRTSPWENLLGGVDRMESFLKYAKATAVVTAYLSGGPGEAGQVQVRIAEMSRQPGSHLVQVARADTSWVSPEAAVDVVSRTVSNWLSCTVLPSREAVDRPHARFFLDTAGAYSVYLKVPTRRIFSNAGFGIGLSWQIKDGLDVFGRVNLLNAFEDPYGDLFRQFWTVRTTAGVGYSVRGYWGRVFLHTGIVLDYLSGFESTTNPNCKFWPDDPARCPASNVRRPRYLFGATVALGVNVTIFGPIFFTFQIGMGAFFVSNESDTPVNFPLSLDLGLGYAFF